MVPQLCPGGGVEGVEVAVIAPDIDHPVCDFRGGVNAVPGREVPELGAVVGVEGIDVFISPGRGCTVNDGGCDGEAGEYD